MKSINPPRVESSFRNRSMGLLALLVACIAYVSGCEPLTYSRDSKLDFSRYRTAAVDVNDGDIERTDYLVDELVSVSGFQEVHRESDGPADVFIDVWFDIAVTTSVDSDGNTSTDYDGTANYTATDAHGAILFTDSESDSSFSYEETIEDVLDEVAHMFMGSYRI
ncbi:MAG: hypothetical protein QM784_04660 [Polyangiaceae bacterium]